MQGTVATSPPAAAPALSRRRLVLLLAGLVLVSLNLRSIFTVVGPLVADIRADTGLSRSATGMLTTLPLIAFGAVSLFAPRIAARFGSDRTLVASMLLLTAALAIRPLPPLALLFVGTLAAGCGVAITNVLLPAVIKRDFPAHAAFMVAVYSIVLGIGAVFAAGVAVPSMDWLGGSWRAALAIWAAPALLGALAWLPQLRRAPRRERDAAPRVHVGLWRDAIAWQVTGFLASLSFLFYSLSTWLPDLYRAEGLSAASAGGLLSIALIAGLPLGVVVGVAAQRLEDQRPLALVSGLLSLGGWLGVLLAPMTAPWLWASLLGCGAGIGFPLVLTLMLLRAPDARHAAELSGMSQAVGYSVAAAGPVVIGGLHDVSGGWTLPLVVLVAGHVPLFALGLGASRPGYVGGSE